MHFSHPVQVGPSTSKPRRVKWMASGGQSGMHKPQASQMALSTTAMRCRTAGRGIGAA